MSGHQMRASRREIFLEATVAVSAALFGWFVTTENLRAFAAIPAAIALGAFIGSYFLAESRWQNEVRARLASLLAVAQIPGDPRATLHTRLRGQKGYRQAVDYVPNGSGKGRKFELDDGIAGRCFTRNQQLIAVFESQAEYDERMVSEYGFDARELSRRVQSRRSFLAHPVHNERLEVVGVIFMDSNDPDALPPSGTAETAEMIALVAGEIAKLATP